MNNNRTLGMVATGAAAAAIASFFLVGEMPPAPAEGVCTVSWAAGPCEAAVAFSAGDVVCTPGSIVTMPVEIVLPPEALGGSGGVDTGNLDAAFVPVADTTTVVDCATFTRPGVAMTVVPVEKHGRRLGTYRTLGGELVEGTGPFCPPVVVAGLVPEGCE